MATKTGGGKLYSGKRAEARALEVNRILTETYPAAECALKFGGEAWKLVIMGRLSAQCTDKRVNEVCETLFEVFPTIESLASAEIEEIEAIVRPCGLYHVKARDLKAECEMIVEKFGGRVPDTMEELLELPGVGRKIANLILGDIYNKGGIVADTHCIRICGRLGFYPEDDKNPVKTEKIMSPLVPVELQSDFCHRLVMFGREYCKAQSPTCSVCPMQKLCTYSEKK